MKYYIRACVSEYLAWINCENYCLTVSKQGFVEVCVHACVSTNTKQDQGLLQWLYCREHVKYQPSAVVCVHVGTEMHRPYPKTRPSSAAIHGIQG